MESDTQILREGSERVGRKWRRSRFRILFPLALALGVVAAVFAFMSVDSGPMHGGQTAKEWFYGTTGHPGQQSDRRAAVDAFVAMGTNAVPFLVAKARTKRTGLNEMYCSIYGKLPQALKNHVPVAVRSSLVQSWAFHYLQYLGDDVDIMADEILHAVPLIQDEGTRRGVFLSQMVMQLLKIRPERRREFYMQYLDDPDFEIQFQSVIRLSLIDPSITNGIPFLQKMATNEAFVFNAMTSSWSTAYPPQELRAMLDQMVELNRKRAFASLQLLSSSNSISDPYSMLIWK